MTNLLTVLLCASAAFGGGGDDIEVRVRTGALVRGVDVKIGELCEITPINRDTLALADIVFAPSPAGGSSRTVTRTEIVQRIAAAGHDVGQFTFSGPTEIIVQPVRVEVPAAEMIDAASAAAVSSCADSSVTTPCTSTSLLPFKVNRPAG